MVKNSNILIEKKVKDIRTELQLMQKSLGSVQLTGIVLGENNNVIIHNEKSVRNGKTIVIDKVSDNEIAFIEIGKIVDYKFLGNTKIMPQGTPVFVKSD